MLIRVVGGFQLLDSNGRDVTPRSRRGCCILSYLTLTGQSQVRRELLTSLLWSESDEQRARSSFRQALRELRAISATQSHEFISADRHILGFRPPEIGSDIAIIEQSIKSLDVPQLVKHFGRSELDLLTGYDSIDPVFDSWLRVERENFVTRSTLALVNLLQTYELQSDEQMRIAEIVLTLDPFAEEAVRVRMEGHTLLGNPKAAIDVFESYSRELRTEYELDASDDLVRFANDIRDAKPIVSQRMPRRIQKKLSGPPNSVLEIVDRTLDQSSTASKAAKSRSAGPAVAVLAQMISAASDEFSFIADAFCNDLIATMSRFSEWMVVTPNILAKARAALSHQQIALSLADKNLDYLVTCDVSMGKTETVAIELTLLECATATIELRSTYEVESRNRVALLNDISCKIAAHMQQAIVQTKLHKVAKKSTRHKEAYDAWLEGHHLFFKWEQDAEEKKISLFEQAIELDNNFASAYSSLAAVLNSRWFVLPGFEDDESVKENALTLARKAVEIDPLDSKHHVNLAWSHLLSRRHDCAELHFNIAINLNPANPNVLMAAALANAFSGNHSASRELSERAFDLNSAPQDWYYGYVATIAFLNGQFEECVEAVSRVPGIFPDIMGWSAAAHYRLGQKTRAHEDLAQFYSNLRQSWSGPAVPDENEMREWFVNIFPIRDTQQREVLASSIRALT